MAMSVVTQTIFPDMSDARTPAMDVGMTGQDTRKARSFLPFLSAMLNDNNVYRMFCVLKRAYLYTVTDKNRTVCAHSALLINACTQYSTH